MFRFTIRDLLWLMVVVALGLAWLAASHRGALLEARCQGLERAQAGQKAIEQELLKKIHELESAANVQSPTVRAVAIGDN